MSLLDRDHDPLNILDQIATLQRKVEDLERGIVAGDITYKGHLQPVRDDVVWPLGRVLVDAGGQMNTTNDNITNTTEVTVNTVDVVVPAGGILVATGNWDIEITYTSACNIYLHLDFDPYPDDNLGLNADSGRFPKLFNTGRHEFSTEMLLAGYDEETTVTIDQKVKLTTTGCTAYVYTTWTRISYLVFA